MDKKVIIIIISLLTIFGLYGCGNKPQDNNLKEKKIDYITTQNNLPEMKLRTISDNNIMTPTASGKIVFNNDIGIIDASNADQGYIMAEYYGESEQVRLQIDTPTGNTYTYVLYNQMDCFPLTEGDGKYDIRIYEHVIDSKYSLALSGSITVYIEDKMLPFLYPNQFVWYEKDWNVIRKSNEIVQNCNNDIEMVQAVYSYITQNIEYNYNIVDKVQYGYLPNVDTTIKTGKGICFDFASLMCAMLRIQGIPCKLEIGYVDGDVYHAWLSVYTKDSGWIDKCILFEGETWNLIDPTFGASVGTEEAKKYIDNHEYDLIFTY